MKVTMVYKIRTLWKSGFAHDVVKQMEAVGPRLRRVCLSPSVRVWRVSVIWMAMEEAKSGGQTSSLVLMSWRIVSRYLRVGNRPLIVSTVHGSAIWSLSKVGKLNTALYQLSEQVISW